MRVLGGEPGDLRCWFGWHRVRGSVPTCTRCDGVAAWWLAEQAQTHHMPKPEKAPKEDHTTVVGVFEDTYYSFSGPGQLKRWRKSDLSVILRSDLPADAVVTPIPEAYEFPKPVKS